MRINDKIEEIKNYLNELSSFVPQNFEEYENNFKTKAACERYFEKIIEAVIDLSFLLVREKSLNKPEDEISVFDILSNNEFISKVLSDKMKDAKGMRNILSHEYGSVDDKLVFNALTEELEKDVTDFLKRIKEHI